jgi:hypothetical protein
MRYPVLAILIVAGLALLHQPQEPVAGPVPCDAQSSKLAQVPPERQKPVPKVELEDSSAKTSDRELEQRASSPKKGYPLYPAQRQPGTTIAVVEPNVVIAYVEHLYRDHGFDRKWVTWLANQRQGPARLVALHSDAHNEVVDKSLAVYGAPVLAEPVKQTAPIVITVKRATAIKWVTEKEARADKTKPDWYFCTRKTGCPACIIAKGNFYNPAVISASQDFNCVMVYGDDYGRFKVWADYRGLKPLDDRGQVRHLFPEDFFVSADEKFGRWYQGKPVTEELLHRFAEIRAFFRNPAANRDPATSRFMPPKQLRALLPTLAASSPPQTQTDVEAKQQSSVTRRAMVPSGSRPAGVAPGVSRSRQSHWTPSSAGRIQKPGVLGRATFRPSPLLR